MQNVHDITPGNNRTKVSLKSFKYICLLHEQWLINYANNLHILQQLISRNMFKSVTWSDDWNKNIAARIWMLFKSWNHTLSVRWHPGPVQALKHGVSMNYPCSFIVQHVSYFRANLAYKTVLPKYSDNVDVAAALHWRHNERDVVSNHQPHDC